MTCETCKKRLDCAMQEKVRNIIIRMGGAARCGSYEKEEIDEDPINDHDGE